MTSNATYQKYPQQYPQPKQSESDAERILRECEEECGNQFASSPYAHIGRIHTGRFEGHDCYIGTQDDRLYILVQNQVGEKYVPVDALSGLERVAETARADPEGVARVEFKPSMFKRAATAVRRLRKLSA